MPDALPAATLPIYPGLGPASRDTKSASDGWLHGVVSTLKKKICFPKLCSPATSLQPEVETDNDDSNSAIPQKNKNSVDKVKIDSIQ